MSEDMPFQEETILKEVRDCVAGEIIGMDGRLLVGFQRSNGPLEHKIIDKTYLELMQYNLLRHAKKIFESDKFMGSLYARSESAGGEDPSIKTVYLARIRVVRIGDEENSAYFSEKVQGFMGTFLGGTSIYNLYLEKIDL